MTGRDAGYSHLSGENMFGIAIGVFFAAAMMLAYSSVSPFRRSLPNRLAVGSFILAYCGGIYSGFAFCPKQSLQHILLQNVCSCLVFGLAIYTHSQFLRPKRHPYACNLLCLGFIFHGVWDLLLHSKLQPWDTSADTAIYSPFCFIFDIIIGLWYYATRNSDAALGLH